MPVERTFSPFSDIQGYGPFLRISVSLFPDIAECGILRQLTIETVKEFVGFDLFFDIEEVFPFRPQGEGASAHNGEEKQDDKAEGEGELEENETTPFPDHG